MSQITFPSAPSINALGIVPMKPRLASSKSSRLENGNSFNAAACAAFTVGSAGFASLKSGRFAAFSTASAIGSMPCDEIGRLFGNHDRRRVGVAADERRHDRGIDHAQSFDPAHAQFGINHRVAVDAHLAGADRVIDRVGAAAQHVANLFVGLGAAADQILAAHARERRRLKNSFGEAKAFDHGVEVAAIVVEFRIDQRRRRRIGALQGDKAAAFRPQQADMAREAVAEAALAAVIHDLADHEMKLDVGNFLFRARLQKSAGLREIRRDHAAAFPAIAADLAQDARDAAEGYAEEIKATGAIGKDEIDMVLKIAPNRWKIVNDADSELLQMIAVTDARKHQ